MFKIWEVITAVIIIINAICHVELITPNNSDSRFGQIFDEINDPTSRLIRPNYTGPATKVDLDFSVDSIGEISNIRKTIQLTIYLRQRWKDYRYRHNYTEKITPSLGPSGHPVNYIWIPDTTLVNMKIAKKHTKNDKLDIWPDGTIFWATMITMEVKCDMEFHDFPIDSQTCMFGFESYSHDINHINYTWYGEHIHFVSKEAEQFVLKNYTTTRSISKYIAGDFVVLKVYFELERQLQVTILQIFFPAVLVVCVSWVTLWMHKRSPSARVGLGTTTLLTLTMIWLSANTKIPKVSYVKAIDIYFMISFCFILGVLFEYVVVTNINFTEWKNKSEDKELKKRKRKSSGACTTMMEMKSIKEQSKEIARKSSSSLTFKRRYDKDGEHKKRMEEMNNIFCEKTTIQEMIDEGFELDDPESESDSSGESECSDDDIAGTKNSILLDRRVISMFLDTRPATLDIVCRFLFPFCYLCFASYWWLHFIGKRNNQVGMGCERLVINQDEMLKECTNHHHETHLPY